MFYKKNKKIDKKITIPALPHNSGQAMLTAVIFFLAISMTVVLGIATPILKQVKISNDMIRSVQSYYLSEGALEDAIYRVKNSKTINSGETIVVNGYTTTITLTSTGSGKLIDTSTTLNGVVRKMESQITTGVGSDFGYGIQSGNGGFNLSGGSRINGNVYSNGTIVATNGVTITGSAIAADSPALSADQSNASPIPITSCTPSTCVTFRNSSATQDIAQSFKVSSMTPLHDIQFYIEYVGTSRPSDITVRIVTDSSGSPSTNDLLTTDGTLSAALVGTSFGLVDVPIPTSLSLDPSQTYWIVLSNGSNSSSKYYIIGANTSYANGHAMIGKYNGTWNALSPSNLSIYFNLYLGGQLSSIGGGTYVGAVNIGTGSVGDAWANSVSGASVAGNLYCQTGSNNNKTCNTTKSDPPPVGFPISDSNIQQWKTDAVTGPTGWTYNGSLSLGSQGTTTTSLTQINGSLTTGGGGTATFSNLIVNGDVTIGGGSTLSVGPMKVNGNLNIGSTKLNIKGTIWVTGNIILGGGATVQLDPSYGANSGVLISDGYDSLGGGGNFYGSGQSTSFPLILTTSDCPLGPTCSGNNAIDFSGGAGAVVLDAQKGTIHMSGGTTAEAITANQINIDGGTTVTYNSGLANLNFSSGPSGGYNISTWKEVQ